MKFIPGRKALFELSFFLFGAGLLVSGCTPADEKASPSAPPVNGNISRSAAGKTIHPAQASIDERPVPAKAEIPSKPPRERLVGIWDFDMSSTVAVGAKPNETWEFKSDGTFMRIMHLAGGKDVPFSPEKWKILEEKGEELKMQEPAGGFPLELSLVFSGNDRFTVKRMGLEQGAFNRRR